MKKKSLFTKTFPQISRRFYFLFSLLLPLSNSLEYSKGIEETCSNIIFFNYILLVYTTNMYVFPIFSKLSYEGHQLYVIIL